ncbi:MAG TPA: hypothetical protein VK601_07590, partial [Kofleriaceae bacterium]|nr:hypothetical protein [Kofleriaceae bacterium]
HTDYRRRAFFVKSQGRIVVAVVCELDRTSQFVGKLMIKRIDAAACRLLHEPSFEGGNPLIGRWVNFDREAPDITGVTVRADGDRLAIAIDQADRDGARHWSALSGAAMAERTGGGPAIGFLAMGDLFAEQGAGPHAGALCAYLNRGLLTIDTYVTDIRKSANVMTRVHLHLAEDATP